MSIEIRTILTALCGYQILGIAYGEHVICEVLTECCRAATTGTISGVCCKECLRLIPEEEGVGGSRYELEKAARRVGCPCPLECADHMLWALDRELSVQEDAA